jgi:hypothetical protein
LLGKILIIAALTEFAAVQLSAAMSISASNDLELLIEVER